MEVTVDDPEKVETLRADSQGRVSLGVEYAGRTVTILVADSEAERTEDRGVQQIIGGEPMAGHERKGLTFVRVFGIDPEYLRGDASNPADESIDPESVGYAAVDWSRGVVIDENNVARFELPTDRSDETRFGDQFTAEAVEVHSDEESYGEPVYCFANEDGATSAIDQELVTKVKRVYGYDPTEDLSRVRLHPENPDHPVVFEDAVGETRIVVAPRIKD